MSKINFFLSVQCGKIENISLHKWRKLLAKFFLFLFISLLTF